MIKEVYQALKKRLLEIDEIKRVDWFMDQYNEADEDGELVYETPVAYIEFPPIEWQTLPGNIQRANITFSVHLVTENVESNDQKIIDTTYGDHAGIDESVFVKLMNWRTKLSFVDDYAGLLNTANDRILIESIVRNVSEPDHTLTVFLVTVQQFSCMIYDYSAVKNWTKHVAKLKIQASLDDNVNF